MFCSKCGTELADDAKFCSKCGASTVQKAESDESQSKRDLHQTDETTSEKVEAECVDINEAKRMDRLMDRIVACLHPVALVCVIFSLICCLYIRVDRHAISLVKDSSFADYAPNKSINDLVDNFIASPKWKCRHEGDNCFVDIKGKILYGGKKTKVTLTFQVYKKEENFSVVGLNIGGQEMNDAFSINSFLYSMSNQ
ncbi:zinc ribbon domain-containing protein [uncultured Treponema sp.]|uniref:zinc ribbon domain-containing protein n=1 Tax=uncultured Treponema sp. TaxID=162155 RepID=UPI0025E65360|nr:zinc ribbon domain-containing protein [uncultured Treponema sp.]